MKKVIRIDENGLFLEDVILQDFEATPKDCIDVHCPGGFYYPKFDKESNTWVEGGTAPTPTPEQEIAKLKAEIQSTDYKIIKCSEFQLTGQELPYDIAKLHSDRQALRDRINELETL